MGKYSLFSQVLFQVFVWFCPLSLLFAQFKNQCAEWIFWNPVQTNDKKRRVETRHATHGHISIQTGSTHIGKTQTKEAKIDIWKRHKQVLPFGWMQKSTKSFKYNQSDQKLKCEYDKCLIWVQNELTNKLFSFLPAGASGLWCDFVPFHNFVSTVQKPMQWKVRYMFKSICVRYWPNLHTPSLCDSYHTHKMCSGLNSCRFVVFGLSFFLG